MIMPWRQVPFGLMISSESEPIRQLPRVDILQMFDEPRSSYMQEKGLNTELGVWRCRCGSSWLAETRSPSDSHCHSGESISACTRLATLFQGLIGNENWEFPSCRFSLGCISCCSIYEKLPSSKLNLRWSSKRRSTSGNRTTANDWPHTYLAVRGLCLF